MAIINGGFEDGDFTGWTHSSDNWQVTTDAARSGTYGAQATPEGYDTWSLYQTIDITGYNTSLDGYFNIPSYTISNNGYIEITISLYTTDWSLIATIFSDVYTESNLPEEGWVHINYDTSLLSGEVILRIYIHSTDGGAY